jgi:hypothetical protein
LLIGCGSLRSANYQIANQKPTIIDESRIKERKIKKLKKLRILRCRQRGVAAAHRDSACADHLDNPERLEP